MPERSIVTHKEGRRYQEGGGGVDQSTLGGKRGGGGAHKGTGRGSPGQNCIPGDSRSGDNRNPFWLFRSLSPSINGLRHNNTLYLSTIKNPRLSARNTVANPKLESDNI